MECIACHRRSTTAARRTARPPARSAPTARSATSTGVRRCPSSRPAPSVMACAGSSRTSRPTRHRATHGRARTNRGGLRRRATTATTCTSSMCHARVARAPTRGASAWPTAAAPATTLTWTSGLNRCTARRSRTRHDPKAANCADCHSSHRVGPPRSDTVKLAILASCGNCHEDAYRSYRGHLPRGDHCTGLHGHRQVCRLPWQPRHPAIERPETLRRTSTTA